MTRGTRRELAVLNRQRRWAVDVPRVRRLAERLLGEALGLDAWEIGIHLISARAMSRLNQRWLQHEGSTDIITFDLRENAAGPIHGELFISLDDADRQGREFQTSASLELARYIAHGALHLLGFDDLDPEARRVMKREEDRLTRRLARMEDLSGLVRPAASSPRGAKGLRAGRRSVRRS
jgi:probable rRNA maturation factor